MDKEILIQAGLSEIQANIYLFLIENGQKTPTEIAEGISEKRTTVYSAIQKLEKSELISKKDKGKISAYIPNHPSALESLAEKRLRQMARQIRNLESNLPSLINFYNEHQNEPGSQTFYGKEGVEMIWNKAITTKKPFYFVRSRYDGSYKEELNRFKNQRVKNNIASENITASEFINDNNKEMKEKYLLSRTILPPGEYDSPIEIDIFGDNVAFINFEKNGMSTLIESPEIANAMRQFFLFSKKYIRKATNQDELDENIKTPSPTSPKKSPKNPPIPHLNPTFPPLNPSEKPQSS